MKPCAKNSFSIANLLYRNEPNTGSAVNMIASVLHISSFSLPFGYFTISNDFEVKLYKNNGKKKEASQPAVAYTQMVSSHGYTEAYIIYCISNI